ncbi:MAG: HEAT repeat domain-containing protein [Spirochaetales bacterium]|nr:HEAT repeat domain-containing protein [Spirochaetales bacterium]
MKGVSWKIAVLCLAAFCLPGLPASAQDDEAEEGRGLVETWRDVLRFGIDSEVLKVIKAIDEADERSLDGELGVLFAQSLNTEVRSGVLELFGARGSAALESAAVTLLEQEELEDPILQVALIRYLATIQSSSVEPELLRLIEEASLAGADERVVESALSALGRLGSESGGALLMAKLEDLAYPESLKPEIILALGKLQYRPAVEALMEIASDRGAERIWRMYAATSLGEIGDARAVGVLKGMFREQDSLLKVHAASALAHFGMDEVEGLLQQGLRDSNERVRAAAARGLASPEATGSVDILIYKARNDPAVGVRIEAIRALGGIGSPASLRFLRELYAERLAGVAYREEALLALCKKDLPGSLKAIEAVVDAEWTARDQKVIGFTVRILSTCESPGLGALFARFAGHPDVGVRMYALRGIGKNRLGSLREAVEKLSRDDPHPAVRRTAATTLQRL